MSLKIKVKSRLNLQFLWNATIGSFGIPLSPLGLLITPTPRHPSRNRSSSEAPRGLSTYLSQHRSCN